MRLTPVQAIELFHTWPESDRRDYHIYAHLNGNDVVTQMQLDEINSLSVRENKLKLVPKVGSN